MTIRKTGWLATILAALAVCTLAHAEAPKNVPPAKTEAMQTDAPKQGTAGRTYTPETLRAMLDNMGYDYKANASNSGDYYVVTVNHDGWTFFVQVECSPDGSEIWFSQTVGDFPNADQTPAAVLLTLLEKNVRESGKAVFRKDGKHIVLSQPVDNHDVTPARFRAELDRFCTAVKIMQPFYDAAAKGQADAKTTAKVPEAK